MEWNKWNRNWKTWVPLDFSYTLGLTFFLIVKEEGWATGSLRPPTISSILIL